MDEVVKRRVQFYKDSKENREKGVYNGIPIYKYFPRLGTLIPAIMKGDMIMFTAGPGIGKTQFWIGMILFITYKLIKSEGIKVRFIIFLLEDNIEMFTDRLFSLVLYDRYKIKIDGLTLKSLREKLIDDDTFHKINQASIIVEEILSYCDIIDTVHNPFGLYKYCRNKSSEWGIHYYKRFMNENNSIITHEEYSKFGEKDKEGWKYSHYEPYDNDTQTVVITDNLNNLSSEKGGNRMSAMNKWTSEYCRLQISKYYKFTCINIQQQSLESEKQEFTYRGDSIINKCKPSLDGLGNAKETSRDHYIILGLFAPDRFGISEYKLGGITYDIRRLGDNFRSLIVLKSNISECNKELPLVFYGACSTIKEMPKEQLTDEMYKKIKNYEY